MMGLNPEFRRNLWVELSPQRLVAMPAILGGVFFLVHLLVPGSSGAAVARVALVAYLGLALLWGARLASEAVLGETREHTWDLQRMSSLGAWSMTWGKLLGSTVYPWYGALMCLAVYAVAQGVHPGAAADLLVLLGAGLLAQAVALLASLQSMARRAAAGRSAAASYLLLGIFAAVPFLRTGLGRGEMVHWYGAGYPGDDFALASLLIFLAWSVVAIYRHLRRELQMRSGPLVWLLFVVFLAAYVAGFVRLPDVGLAHVATARWYVAYIMVLLLAYVMVFAEPKDGVALRRLWHAAAHRAWVRVWQGLPLWAVTIALVVVFGAVLLTQDVPEFLYRARVFEPRTFVLATFLFLLRDVGLVLYLNLGARPARADAAALLYLAVLYVLLPGILSALHLHVLAAAFLPWQAGHGPVLLVAGAVQMLLAAGLALRRWNRRFGINSTADRTAA
ncbi:MAG: hypothetical protein P8090_16350 [Gammaproteobacteria bacterium]